MESWKIIDTPGACAVLNRAHVSGGEKQGSLRGAEPTPGSRFGHPAAGISCQCLLFIDKRDSLVRIKIVGKLFKIRDF